MSFRVSGKNLDVGDALRERINDRIAETLGKYFDGGYSGHVTLAKDGFGFRTECAIHLDSKITLHAEGIAPDAYASADQAAARIEKRLRRYHRRLKDHRAERNDEPSIDAASYIIAAPEDEGETESGAFTPVIIAESTTALKRLSVSDAVTELDMTGAPVVVFRHAAHGGINIVYRRADGHFGWIDPPALAGADGH
ncbi:MAG TPA: ribosome-associated translation inhibitor RaiA [Xanthobacteraceae bacterium]|jgi:ribosomal subunit interface protein|nr:ribosome-associated translation inhibitor RaiA [Xanthobacteraceae bacterium]